MNTDTPNTNFGSDFDASKALEERAASFAEVQTNPSDAEVAPVNWTETAPTAPTYSEVSCENYDLSSDSYKYDLLDKFTFAPESLVVVGDSVVYFGGELTSDQVVLGGKPITGRVFSEAIKQDVDLAVKSIQEGKRIIAFAVDAEKAKNYIKRFKKELAA